MSRDSWKVISACCIQRMEYKGDGGHNVKTGDETNVVLWFGLLAVSMAGIVGVIFFRKKRKIK